MRVRRSTGASERLPELDEAERELLPLIGDDAPLSGLYDLLPEDPADVVEQVRSLAARGIVDLVLERDADLTKKVLPARPSATPSVPEQGAARPSKQPAEAFDFGDLFEQDDGTTIHKLPPRGPKTK